MLVYVVIALLMIYYFSSLFFPLMKIGDECTPTGLNISKAIHLH